MNKYIAIGHFKANTGLETYTRSIVMSNRNRKGFCTDLRGNGFVAYAVFTEEHWNKLKAINDSMDLYEAVKKLTTNYRKWNELTDYIEQCGYIIDENIAACVYE